jgi:hypothetical protein
MPQDARMTTCLCGCGQIGRGSSYRPGHDARHASRIGRAMAAAGEEDPELLAQLPSDALRAKALKMLAGRGSRTATGPRPVRAARQPRVVPVVPARVPDPVVPHGVDFAGLTTRQLLRLYADLLTELVDRKVVRSRNAPLGDLAEYLVHRAYGGELAPPSEKAWDVRTPDGRLLQVKARLIADGHRRSHQYSPFRSWGFHACVFLIFDAHTYDVVQAVEVPVGEVQGLARETTWVRGSRVSTRTPLLGLAGAVDRTAAVTDALRELDTLRQGDTHPE